MKKFTVLILGLFFWVSCEDFLVEEPKTQIAVDQYFKTPQDARSTVNILYRDGVTGFFYAGSAYAGSTAMMGGYMSGLFDNEYKGQEVHVQNMQALTLNPVNMSTYFGNQWSSAYQAIGRANMALKYVPETEGLSEAEAQSLLAEARFFRALNYFYLVRAFGAVPLILEPYEEPENLFVERDDQAIVYDQIIEDLNWALAEGGLADATFPDNGFRITNGTVATLLADVHLQRAGFPVQDETSYAAAAASARSVIESGVYSLIEHGSDEENSAYNVLRTSDNEPEYIYAIEFEESIQDNGWLPAYSYPSQMAALGLFTYAITTNVYRPVEEFILVYDPDLDLRVQEQQFFHTQREIDGELYEFELSPYLYHDTEALFETNRGDKNVNVYRYAEVLLIAAEAIARSEGVNAEAVGYLADVRSRAYWETDRAEIEAELSGLSEQEFVEEVWKERLREFALEHKVWSDIQRTRLYPETSEDEPGEVTFVDVIGHTNPWGSTFQEHHLLFPISDDELQRNPALVQNPGY